MVLTHKRHLVKTPVQNKQFWVLGDICKIICHPVNHLVCISIHVIKLFMYNEIDQYYNF